MYLKSQGYLKVPNDLKIGESHPIDEHLRPIKVGGKSTAIEVAQCDDGMRVRGNMEIMGDLRTDSKNYGMSIVLSIYSLMLSYYCLM